MRALTIAAVLLAPLVANASDFGITERGQIGEAYRTPALPRSKVFELKPIAELGNGPNIENSGIVRSRRFDDTYWIQNDSGDEPRIYPVNEGGEVYGADRYDETSGVLISGAINVDWEDIAIDSAGNILVADFGNNSNDRRDLVIYEVPEPRREAGRTAWRNRWFFEYPDQTSYPAPPEDFNFDSEALFTVENEIYVLSKNRSDPFTKLYHLREPQPNITNELVYIGRFNVRGKATGADTTPDGLKLVITTYDLIWLFERTSLDQPFFSGRISFLRYESPQVEAVAFRDDDSLLLADEELGALLRVDLRDFTPYP